MPGFTQAQIDALTAAIAQGATRVQYGDRSVQYGSIPEMLALRDRMMHEMQNQGAGRRPPVARFSVYRRG